MRPRLDAESTGTAALDGSGNVFITYPAEAYGYSNSSDPSGENLRAYRLDTGAEVTINQIQATGSPRDRLLFSGTTLNGVEIAAGVPVDASVTLTPPQFLDENGVVLFNRIPRTISTAINYEDSGSFSVSWVTESRGNTITKTNTITAPGTESGVVQYSTSGLGTTVNVTITSVDARPVAITGYTQEIRGGAR